MPESIADIVLRLARREITSGAPAQGTFMPHLASGWPGVERSERPVSEPSPAAVEPQSDADDSTGSTRRQAAQVEPKTAGAAQWSNPGQAFPASPIAAGVWPLASGWPGVERSEGPARDLAPVTHEPRMPFDDPSPSTRESPAHFESALDVQSRGLPSGQTFPAGPTGAAWPGLERSVSPETVPAHAISELQAFDESQSTGASRWSSPGHPASQSAESVDERARSLEQLARDLDASLDRLFATQLETLDHLRQRLDEHERHWLEQNAARRATLV